MFVHLSPERDVACHSRCRLTVSSRRRGVQARPVLSSFFVSRPGALEKKYRRSAMENRRRLQCKALQRREKCRLSKNNGKQWKNNAKNNGSNEKG
jgi:hypothetical protein